MLSGLWRKVQHCLHLQVFIWLAYGALLKVFFFFSANDNEEGQEQTGGGGLSDKVSLYKGDITVLEVDAIVNAGKDPTLQPFGVLNHVFFAWRQLGC